MDRPNSNPIDDLDSGLQALAAICDLVLEARGPTLAHVDPNLFWFLLDLVHGTLTDARARL